MKTDAAIREEMLAAVDDFVDEIDRLTTDLKDVSNWHGNRSGILNELHVTTRRHVENIYNQREPRD